MEFNAYVIHVSYDIPIYNMKQLIYTDNYIDLVPKYLGGNLHP